MAEIIHLCWKCQNACNSNLCCWVRTLSIYPKGCKFDAKNNIIYCPKFKRDKKITISLTTYFKWLQKTFSISNRTCWRTYNKLGGKKNPSVRKEMYNYFYKKVCNKEC